MVREDLEAGLARGDWAALGTLLVRLDEAQLKEARAWYRSSGRAAARRHARSDAARRISGAQEQFQLCQALLAAHLAARGQDAARSLELGKTWWPGGVTPGLPLVVGSMVSRGPEWCREFVSTAAAVRLTQNGRWSSGVLAALCLPLVEHFDLEVPESGIYAWGWAGLADGITIQRWGKVREEFWPGPMRIGTTGAEYVRVAPEAADMTTFFTVTPKLADTLASLLRTPDAIAALVRAKDPDGLAPALHAAFANGTLCRSDVIRWTLEALARNDSIGAQKDCALLLGYLELLPKDLDAHVPLALSLLPTVHGAVTAVLLPPLLRAPLSPEDLVDVGTIILSRKEKAQQATLLTYLAKLADPAMERAVTQILRGAAASSDPSLASRGASILERRGGAVEPAAGGAAATQAATATVDGLWRMPSEPVPWSVPFEPIEASEAGLRGFRSRCRAWIEGIDDARWLDVAVRFGRLDPEGLVNGLVVLDDEGHMPRSLERLLRWARTGENATPAYAWTGFVMVPDASGGWTQRPKPFPQAADLHVRLVDRLSQETISRLGTMSGLLSTPDRDDGTLSVAGFVANVRAAESEHYGPYDLLQAMLRVGPADDRDVEALADLTIGTRWRGRDADASAPSSGAPESDASEDGAELVRRWFAGGGLPPRPCSIVEGRAVLDDVEIPDVFAALEHADEIGRGVDPAAGQWWGQMGRDYTDALGVFPHWPDEVAVRADTWGRPDSSVVARRATLFGGAAGVGLGVQHHLARLLAHPTADGRGQAAGTIVELFDQGRLDAECLATSSVELFAHGRLSLARAADGWQQVILAGGIASIWPTALRVADHACTLAKKPSGLGDLLFMMSAYAGAVPPGERPLPDRLRALAASRGTTKAQLGARALVAADARRTGAA